MILNSISMYNFMSYAEAKLDLSSISVACLSGRNGSGKSALLDAVTWALWESARASSEELIRLGQTEMRVELVFELEGITYRVRRTRQRSFGKKGQNLGSKGTLVLQVRASEDAAWLNLSAASMKETQRKIDELLRMDYDTFVTSVYLRQGRADEFTTRSAGERKEVLAEILGLAYFDRLQDLARQELKERKGKIQVLENSLVKAPALAESIASIRTDLERAEIDLEKAQIELDSLACRHAELAEELVRLNSAHKDQEQALRELAQVRREIAHLEELSAGYQVKISNCTELIGRKDEVESRLKRYEELKVQAEALDRAAMRVQSCQQTRMERVSLRATARGRLEVEVAHLQDVLQAKQGRQLKLSAAVAEKDRLTESYQRFKELLQAEAEYAHRRETFGRLSSRVEELHYLLNSARVHLEAELEQKSNLLKELDELLLTKESVDGEQETLKGEGEQLDKLEMEFQLVEERGLKVKTEISTAEHCIEQLKRRIKENNTNLLELNEHPDLSSCPLCKSSIADRYAVVERYNEDNRLAQEEIQSIIAELSLLETKRAALRQDYARLRSELEKRKNHDMRIGQFNEKRAAMQRAQASRDCLKKEIEEIKFKLSEQTYAVVERESLVRVKGELIKLDFDPIIFANLQAQIRSQRYIELRYQQFLSDCRELSEVESSIPHLEDRLNGILEQLEKNSYESELKEQIESLDRQIEDTAYDAKVHEKVRAELSSLISAQDEMRRLNMGESELPDLQDLLAKSLSSIEERTRELKTLECKLELLEAALDNLPELKAELELLSQKREAIIAFQLDTSRTQISLQAKLQHQLESAAEFSDIEESLRACNQEIAEFSALAEAFGKKGIQAVIIDNAIPEIEAEANRILARLSDNQMHVALTTQYRTRQGHLAETLEILIADDVGTRSYELYSGGEAFKVNFALRLALAKVLTRRAGAKLETLIIDEGFGSQDESSRERLVRAINSIRNDFQRILVVTHIAEVKEMFPVQIQVEKKSGLSALALNSLSLRS